MATVKVEQSSINELKSAITFAAEQASQAANMVSKAIDGMSGMSFLAKPRLESELTSLKNRLNQQAQLSRLYCRAVQETVDALAQVDDSAGTSSEGVWSKTSVIVGTAIGAAMGSAVAAGELSLATQDQMDKQSGPNVTFINGTPGLGSSSSPNITFANNTSSSGNSGGPNVTFSAQTSSNSPNVSWNAQGSGSVVGQSAIQGSYINIGTDQHPQYGVGAYKLLQNEGAWIGTDADSYDGPAMISKHGCLITSISMLESLYQGRQITPPEAIKELNMRFSNGANGRYGFLNHADHYSSASFTLESLYEKLKKGPVIVGGNGPYGEHYMVVSGYKGNGITHKLSDFLIENPDKWTQCQSLDQYGYKNLHSIWTRGE